MPRFTGTPVDDEAPQAVMPPQGMASTFSDAVPIPGAMMLPQGSMVSAPAQVPVQAAPPVEAAPQSRPGGRFGGTLIEEAPTLGTGEAFLRGAEQGATFGFGDEARGIVAASPMMDQVQGSGPVSNFLAWNVRNSPLAMISRGAEGAYNYLTGKPGAEQRYNAAVDENRAALRQARVQHPVAAIGGEVVGSLAPALATGGSGFIPQAATATGRLAQGAALGAGAGGLMGFGQGENTLGNRVVEGAKGAAVGGALGFGAEAAMGVGRGVYSRVADALLPVRSTAPVLTADSLAALRGVGLDPARIGDDAALAILGRAQQAGGVTPATLRQAAAGEFNVPLTRGQATAGIGQTAFEEAARADARGNIAGNVLRGFDQRQSEALDAARSGIQGRFAGEGRGLTGAPHEAGESITAGVRDAEAAASQRISEAYRQAGMRGATVQAEGVSGLGQRARAALDADAFVVDPQLTPATTRALAELDQLANLRGMAAQRGVNLKPGDEVAGISLEGLENSRRRINGLFDVAQTKGDREGLRRVKQAFDQHIDDAFDKALLSGDREALSKLKEARGLRAEYGARYERRGTGDDAGGLIERILQRDVTPNEVANWTLGNATLGASPRSVRLVERLRDILGEDSQAWSDIRQATWQRLTTNPPGKTQPGPQAISSSIGEFLNGRGRELAQAMFTTEERQLIERFAATHRTLVAPDKATNRSGTGYEVARASSPWLTRVAGGLGLVGSGGNPAAAGALMTAAKIGTTGNNALKAGRAIQPVTAPAPSSAQAAMIAGLLGGSERDLALKTANDTRAQMLGRLLASGR